jgi:hypothetical protein
MPLEVWIKSIPAKNQRYATCGDWYESIAGTQVRVSDLGDWKKEACVAVHELVEQLVCRADGVTADDVDEYDRAHSETGDEPDIPGSPYRRAHWIAYLVEMQLAAALGLDWTQYGETLDTAYEEARTSGNKLKKKP